MKTLLKIIAVVVALLVVGVLVAAFYIDGLAKRGVEAGAQRALGVEVGLDSADVKLLSGEFTISDLRVDNPQGFQTDHFMTLDRGEAAVTWRSLMEDTVELPHLTLSDVDLNLEKKAGKSNYDVIMANLKKFQGEPKPDAKKFIIRTVTLRNVMVHVDVNPLAGVGGAANVVGGGGELTRLDVPIDEIVLRDVGSQTTGGVLISELSGVLMTAIMTAIVEKAGGVIPQDILGDLSAQLAQLDQLKSLADVEKLGEVVGEITGKIEGDLEDIGEKAKGELDSAIGDLLGGEKTKGKGNRKP